MMHTILDTTISTTIFHFGNCSDSGHIIDMAVAAEAFVLTLAEDIGLLTSFRLSSPISIFIFIDNIKIPAPNIERVLQQRDRRSLHIISPVLATQDFNMTTAVPFSLLLSGTTTCIYSIVMLLSLSRFPNERPHYLCMFIYYSIVISKYAISVLIKWKRVY